MKINVSHTVTWHFKVKVWRQSKCFQCACPQLEVRHASWLLECHSRTDSSYAKASPSSPSYYQTIHSLGCMHLSTWWFACFSQNISFSYISSPILCLFLTSSTSANQLLILTQRYLSSIFHLPLSIWTFNLVQQFLSSLFFNTCCCLELKFLRFKFQFDFWSFGFLL